MTDSDWSDIREEVEVSAEGSRRLRRGHPWVYSGDVTSAPQSPAPLVRVRDAAHNILGFAFYSPDSQIRLRLLSQEACPPTPDLIRERVRRAVARRPQRSLPEGACRLIFGEADLLPSVIVDRYADYLVLQTLSRGAEALKSLLVDILRDLLQPTGILERNDVKSRRLEGLEMRSGILWGTVPLQVQIREGGVRFWVDLVQGQKTGFFLDQAENRMAAGRYASGRCLDCFTNTGAFAAHFAQRCESVIGIDASAQAICLARRNATLNELKNVEFVEANVFDYLRERERAGVRFHTICLDPPAFAKNRSALPAARGGYKEVNLRAMKLLEPEGILVTSSCSYHLPESEFLELLHQAAHDAHRPIQVLERRAQATDHPVLLGMPETHYLKCFIVRAL